MTFGFSFFCWRRSFTFFIAITFLTLFQANASEQVTVFGPKIFKASKNKYRVSARKFSAKSEQKQGIVLIENGLQLKLKNCKKKRGISRFFCNAANSIKKKATRLTRVKSGFVILNKKILANKNQLNHRVGFLKVSAGLKKRNKLKLKLKGGFFSFVRVKVKADDVAPTNLPPVANISADPVSGIAPLVVSFDGSSSTDDSGNIASYSWDFGDGTSAGTGEVENHTYTTVGTFQATLTVTDSEGLSDSQSLEITVSENQPPIAVAQVTPTSGMAPLDVSFDGSGSSDSDGQIAEYLWDFGDGSSSAQEEASHTYSSAGTFTATLTITDDRGAQAQASQVITVSHPTPGPNTLTIHSPTNGSTVTSSPISISGDSEIALSSISVNGEALNLENGGTSFSGDYEVMITAALMLKFEGTTVFGDPVQKTIDVNVVLPGDEEPELPPDPATVAPVLAEMKFTPISEGTSFLYSGPNPIQKNVQVDAIDPVRAGVLRGQVFDANGNSLSGVKVTVHKRPELGETLTRGDGKFDMAINGEHDYVIVYNKPGYLQVQRKVTSRKQDFINAKPVVMTKLDPQVTKVTLAAPGMKVLEGSMVDTAAGERRPLVLIPEGVTAEMVMPDGSLAPLTEMSFRATEYTVGSGGVQAMPSELPPSSAFTYALEFTADEAVERGAENVQFSAPVVFYLENFLGAPQGTGVPLGFLNKGTNQWEAEKDGRVVEILDIVDDKAVISVNAEGDPMTAQEMADLSITDEELTELASYYPVGQSLWRMKLSHFSSYDCNWGSAGRAVSGEQRPPQSELPPLCGGAVAGGSIVNINQQFVSEFIDVVGTPFRLFYHSNRVPGRSTKNSFVLPLGGTPNASEFCAIEVEVDIVGQKTREFFNADLANGFDYEFNWNGLDGYGRRVNGAATAKVKVTQFTPAQYVSVPGGDLASFAQYSERFDNISFGLTSGESCGNLNPIDSGVSFDPSLPASRNVFSASRTFEVPLESGFRNASAMGGWGLDIHHQYDLVSGTLLLGSGGEVSADNLGPSIRTLAGGGNTQTSAGDIPVDEIGIPGIPSMALSPEGEVHFMTSSDSQSFAIRKIKDGQAILVAEPEFSDPASFMEFGPDGSIYFVGVNLDTQASQIYRILPGSSPTERNVELFAGTGLGGGSSGNGGPALEANFGLIIDVTIDSNGRVYIVELNFSDPNSSVLDSELRVIDPSGMINRIVSGGENSAIGPFSGELISALDLGVSGVKVDNEDQVYISSVGGILRLQEDGRVFSVLAKGIGGNGGLEPVFGVVDGISQSGEIYYSSEEGGDLYKINLDGVLEQITGFVVGLPVAVERPFTEGGGLLNLVDSSGFKLNFSNIFGDKLFLSDGSIILTDSVSIDEGFRVFRASPDVLSYTGSAFEVLSQDGRFIYNFNELGVHLNTLNANTGVVVHSFGYDSEGFLVSVTDGDGNITTIERNANGDPTSITPPFAGSTGLVLDSDGYLSSVRTPANREFIIDYDNSGFGLMTSFTRPNTATSTFSYDENGRLIKDMDALGGFLELVKTSVEEPDQIANMSFIVTSAEGVSSETQEIRNSDGTSEFISTSPAGIVSQEELLQDGSLRSQEADGREVFASGNVVDPRFEKQIARSGLTEISLPSGLKQIVKQSRSINGGLANFTTVTDEVDVNGRISTTVFDRVSRTITSTSAGGVVTTTVVDEQERPLSITTPGVLPIEYFRDQQGRLIETRQGDRSTFFGYDTNGFLSSEINALNQTTTFINNADGEVIEQILPGNRHILFDRDGNGNITAVTTPTNNEHLTVPNLLDLLVEFVAPEASSGQGADVTTYDYNLDKKLVSVENPDNKSIISNYDIFGRLESQEVPSGVVTFGYSSTTGQLNSIVSADGINLSLNYDGELLIRNNWSGAISGDVEQSYNNDFLVESRSVNGGNTIPFFYNDDGNVIEAGGLSLFYNPNNGLLTSTTLGTLTESIGYNGFGEVSSLSTASLFAESFTRDKLGRIATETETIGGAITNYEYFYDEIGQLDQVMRNGALASDYDYDANGNRTQSLQNGQTQSAAYDNQDRLISFGDLTFTYNRNGDLLTKVNTALSEATTYDYDVFGNLKEVNLPDGRQIEYLVDGQNRRVGKKVNGSQVQGLLYKDQLNPVAELDGSGVIVSHFVYASKTHVPDYLIKNGTTYKIVSDHLGSVRLVVNASTGAVAQRMDYDEWGVVLQDTNPGFQPFGFAGGLYDSDTGLVRFGARDYDASIGRWTAKDPIGFEGDASNLFRYTNNDPVNFKDVTGEGPISATLICESVGAISAIAGVAELLSELDFLESDRKFKNDNIQRRTDLCQADKDALIEKNNEKFKKKFFDTTFRSLKPNGLRTALSVAACIAAAAFPGL